MVVRGLLKITKYTREGVWVNIESRDLVGNIKVLIHGVTTKFDGDTHPFEMVIKEVPKEA